MEDASGWNDFVMRIHIPAPTSRAFGPYHDWITDPGSLTAAIRAHAQHFAVMRLRERTGRPLPAEANLLPGNQFGPAIVREVLLVANERPVIFARSILPHASLRGRWQQLRRMGTRPLGQALFSAHGARRTEVVYQKLTSRQPLFRQAAQSLSEVPTHLWARTSVFDLSGRPILVTEVFLPTLLELN